jgi:FkbM family methyltransferase
MKKIRRDGFEIACRNENVFWQTYQEIFVDGEYDFVCEDFQPFIIDCGSHIGLSVLFFKSRYPYARIIAFEPDPDNYELLQRNIVMNELDAVVAINAAVAEYTGSATYYREIFGDESAPDTRGYSISRSWGDRGHSRTLKVQTKRLLPYIQETVSYLKLDVEGVEQAVLEDIEERLVWVQRLCVEYHGTCLNPNENDLGAVVDLLQRNCFEVEVEAKELQEFLPEEFDDWVKTANPELAKICAVQDQL